MPKEMTAGELAERSLITKYRKTIWNRFIGGCKDYELIKPGDRIAVCISGGKDSMMLAKCMQHLQKYSDFPFEAEYLVMDPGYSSPNRELIERNARTLELDPHFRKPDLRGGGRGGGWFALLPVRADAPGLPV